MIKVSCLFFFVYRRDTHNLPTTYPPVLVGPSKNVRSLVVTSHKDLQEGRNLSKDKGSGSFTGT